MAPSTPPPPNKDEFAALTMASSLSVVISAWMARRSTGLLVRLQRVGGIRAIRLEEIGVLQQFIDVFVLRPGERVGVEHRARLLVGEADEVLVQAKAAVLVPQPRDVL